MEEILDLLKQNARLSVKDIAAMTKKTEAEVAAIIKKLEDIPADEQYFHIFEIYCNHNNLMMNLQK